MLTGTNQKKGIDNPGFRDRTGEKHTNNEGYEVEVIEYRGSQDCDVRFPDGYIKYSIRYANIKNGNIKYPFHPNTHGIGYIGVGEYKVCDVYHIWSKMLQRCYSEKRQMRQPTYKDCSVDERWHNFQNFAKWYYENFNLETMRGWHIDKDILQKGNKIYSPETCCFVPHEINSLFTKSEKSRGKLPIGVTKFENKFKATVTKNNKITHLGLFDTPEEAFQVYKIEKEAHIKEVAEKWKHLTTLQTYEVLINYQVEISD